MTPIDSPQSPGARDAPWEHIDRLASGRHGDPFAFLGRHREGAEEVLRCFIPRAREAWVEDPSRPLIRVPDTDLFECRAAAGSMPTHPCIVWLADDGSRFERIDPYGFAPVLNREAMEAFHAGRHESAQDLMGARHATIDGVAGTLFSVWAPNAARVSVVGNFNAWDGRWHPMRLHPEFGIWELFLPGVLDGPYKFEIRNRRSGEVVLKSDPFARATEQRPATAALIAAPSRHAWQDSGWLRRRECADWLGQPMSIYEVHLGSWRRTPEGGFLNYRELAAPLCEHVRALGFTHVELLPMKEHPLDESWGYQSTGYFAPTSRHGSPEDFRAFVDHCHGQGIGVVLDWVPAHFPRDAHALARFDGEPLFEYHDPWKAEHRDWGTLVFNYERHEVCSFLLSSALFWLREFHLDGLRVDAVASMLYLNFSRQAEQWAPNRLGGPHNLEAIEFLRTLNTAVRKRCPGCLMFAEESTEYHGVTLDTEAGGLGFHFKWNMGWMHDTLNYLAKDPVHRKHHQGWLTFGPVYAFNENFVLPLSHDEVVHLKRSLFGRMPGDEWQRFANLRLLYAYQWLYPGKKLLFMGGEFAQESEWDAGAELPWWRAGHPGAKGILRLLQELNRLQSANAALSAWDCDRRGFEWLDGEDRDHSVISFLRRGPAQSLVVVFNFTPVPRPRYRIPLPLAGNYREIFNSDAPEYGGSGVANAGWMGSDTLPHRGRQDSLELTLPPLAAIVLEHSGSAPQSRRASDQDAVSGFERQISRS